MRKIICQYEGVRYDCHYSMLEYQPQIGANLRGALHVSDNLIGDSPEARDSPPPGCKPPGRKPCQAMINRF